MILSLIALLKTGALDDVDQTILETLSTSTVGAGQRLYNQYIKFESINLIC